jgi:hypothetical protein
MNTPKDSTGGCCPPPHCSDLLTRMQVIAAINKAAEQDFWHKEMNTARDSTIRIIIEELQLANTPSEPSGQK